MPLMIDDRTVESRLRDQDGSACNLGQAVLQAKVSTSGMSEAEVTDLVDEAVQWAREQ